jgi:hypothetical protein
MTGDTMETKTTTQQLGTAPGCARRGASAPAVCTSWREITGMPAFPINAYAGNSSSPAGAEHLSFTKRHTRHLALGST